MRTRQIPRAEWVPFFEGFNRRHPQWLATVWLLDPRLGAQVEARELPFEGIVTDPLATSITIELGGRPEKNIDHPVAEPVQVLLQTTDEGAETALGIESADGSRTLLEFRAPVLTEELDGLAAEELPRPRA